MCCSCRPGRQIYADGLRYQARPSNFLLFLKFKTVKRFLSSSLTFMACVVSKRYTGDRTFRHIVTCRSVVHYSLSKYDFPGDSSKWCTCIHDAKLCNGGIVSCRCLSRTLSGLAAISRRNLDIDENWTAICGGAMAPRTTRVASVMERCSATTATSAAGGTRCAVTVVHS